MKTKLKVVDSMNTRVADYRRLRCPACKGPLHQGAAFLCSKCDVRYPMVDGVPVMLSDKRARDGEQDLAVEKKFYEDMFAGLRGLEDGHHHLWPRTGLRLHGRSERERCSKRAAAPASRRESVQARLEVTRSTYWWGVRRRAPAEHEG